MRKTLLSCLLLLCLLALLPLSLAESAGEAALRILPPEGAVLSEAGEPVVMKGRTLKLTGALENAELPKNGRLRWSSSDAAVAAVTAGTVTAKAPGTAEITCTAALADGAELAASLTVRVEVAVSSLVSAAKTGCTVFAGETFGPVEVGVTPVSATCRTVTWSSADESIATVDAEGVITGVSAGKTTVTATSDERTAAPKTLAIPVTVRQGVDAIALDVQEAELAKGKTLALTAAVSPEDATNPKVTWSSSDKTIATVTTAGTVTGVKAGDVEITATAADGSGAAASATVHVYAPVTAFSFGKAPVNVFAGGEAVQLVPTITPENGRVDRITWESADPEIATVDAEGKVSGLMAGSTTVTAVLNDGAKTAAATINVTQGVDAIALDVQEAELAKGKTLALTASVSPEDATNPKVVWTSSDKTIATVTTAGTVTGVKAGDVEITATAADGSGVTACATVHVYAPVTAFSFGKAPVNAFAGGEAVQLVPTITPANGKVDSITWESADPDIATVDAEGRVSGLKAGKTTVTAVLNDGAKTAKATINVTQAVSSIHIEDGERVLLRGSTLKMAAAVGPEDATNPKVIWSSDDPAVAIVNTAGVVTAKGRGKALITATAADGSGVEDSCLIEVLQPVTAIKLSRTTRFAVTEGDTYSLTATALPENANNPRLTWSCDDPSIATVDSATGVVTGIKKGLARITATATDGSGKKATVPVCVEPRIPLDCTTFTRSGYFGYYYQFNLHIKNLTRTRTIKRFDFRLEFNYRGDTYSMSFYDDGTTIGPGAKKSSLWWDQLGTTLTFCSNFRIYLTSVKYSDGTWDFFYDDNLIGWFN